MGIEVRVVEAMPVRMDMYIQRTRREHNKLKVFVSADTEAGAASSSALNSSPALIPSTKVWNENLPAAHDARKGWHRVCCSVETAMAQDIGQTLWAEQLSSSLQDLRGSG